VISLPALDKATAGMSKPWATGGTTISQTSQDQLPQVDSDEASAAAASESVARTCSSNCIPA